MDHDARFEVAGLQLDQQASQKALRLDRGWRLQGVDVLPCFLENGVVKGVLRSVDRLGCGHEELSTNPREEFH